MANNTQNILDTLAGKTIAIVYIFEKENADGFGHFLVWKNKILTGWLNAIYELKCVPYILDVRTFMQKSSNHSLPHMVFYFISLLNIGYCYIQVLKSKGLKPYLVINSFLFPHAMFGILGMSQLKSNGKLSPYFEAKY